MDLTLPYVSLQPDYASAHRDVDQGLHDFEKVWLSVYCQNAPHASIHTKLLLSSPSKGKGKGVEVEVDPANGCSGLVEFQATPASGMDFKVASTSKAIDYSALTRRSEMAFDSVLMRIPKREIGPVVKGHMGVTAFDLAGHRFVAGGSDGQVTVGYIDAGADYHHTVTEEEDKDDDIGDIERLAQSRMRRRERESLKQSKLQLKGHLGDIRSAKFFPSGQVVLTTSSDCTARVFGLDGSNPRTLTGHRRGVTSSYIIDRGHEVLTCSSDGTTRLWDISQGTQKRTYTAYKYSSVDVVTMGKDLDTERAGSSNMILTGLSNGFMEGHDFTSGQSIFCIAPILFPRSLLRCENGKSDAASSNLQQVKSGSIESLDWSLNGHVILAGCSNGITIQYDDRKMPSSSDTENTDQSIVASWQRNNAAINDINLINGGKEAIIATADGTPYRLDISTSPTVLEEYNGWDVDNVQSSEIDHKGRVWLAGAEGMLRMYHGSHSTTN